MYLASATASHFNEAISVPEKSLMTISTVCSLGEFLNCGWGKEADVELEMAKTVVQVETDYTFQVVVETESLSVILNLL